MTQFLYDSFISHMLLLFGDTIVWDSLLPRSHFFENSV